jgi:hypothetical protein
VGWASRWLFDAGFGLVRAIDGAARRPWPQFSLSRLLTRLLGERLVVALLMDQIRPLRLPPALLQSVHHTIGGWRKQPAARRTAS